MICSEDLGEKLARRSPGTGVINPFDIKNPRSPPFEDIFIHLLHELPQSTGTFSTHALW